MIAATVGAVGGGASVAPDRSTLADVCSPVAAAWPRTSTLNGRPLNDRAVKKFRAQHHTEQFPTKNFPGEVIRYIHILTLSTTPPSTTPTTATPTTGKGEFSTTPTTSTTTIPAKRVVPVICTEATVPFVLPGETVRDALQAISDANLVATTAARGLPRSALVTGFFPQAGTPLPFGSQLAIVISIPLAPTSTIPNLIGERPSQASRQVVDAGLTMKAKGGTGPAVEQVPRAGTPSLPAQLITVTFAPPPVPFWRWLFLAAVALIALSALWIAVRQWWVRSHVTVDLTTASDSTDVSRGDAASISVTAAIDETNTQVTT
jgi:hypothetical protein